MKILLPGLLLLGVGGTAVGVFAGRWPGSAWTGTVRAVAVAQGGSSAEASAGAGDVAVHGRGSLTAPHRPLRAPADPRPAAPEVEAEGTRRPPAARAAGRPSFGRDDRTLAAELLALHELVTDLRDDDEKWNATVAGAELLRRGRDPLWSREVREHLEQALFGRDGQQQRIATGLLHALARGGDPGLEPFSPSELLLDRTADELETWDCWLEPRWIPGDAHDETVVAFTLDHIDRMEERLVGKLTSRPKGERFIFAYVLGKAERRHLVDLAAPVLVEHLRDNDIRDDALMGMEALFGLGDAAIPWLLAALPAADRQQRACIELLMREYEDPALTPGGRAARAHLNVVTWKCDDPVQSWHYLEPFVR